MAKPKFTVSTIATLLKSDDMSIEKLITIAPALADLTAKANGEFSVPNDSTLVVLPMAGVTTGNVLVFTSDQQVTVLFNGTIPVDMTDAVLFGLDFTSLKVQNTGASEAHIKYHFAGV